MWVSLPTPQAPKVRSEEPEPSYGLVSTRSSQAHLLNKFSVSAPEGDILNC